MKPLLNTLYVTTQGSYLGREGDAVVIRVERETRGKVPIHTLGGIVCFGQVSISPSLMELCGERDVAITFLSEYGRFLARVVGPVSGNVLLRREQYRTADDPIRCAQIARAIVVAKVANERSVLLRALRDREPAERNEEVSDAANELGKILKSLREELPLDSIRGLEGDAARVYFKVFDHLITAQKHEFSFAKRSRRPPLDKMNALLSFLYTILTHDVSAALQAVGLDPAVGFLHRDRPGRLGLALDLMEELRPILGDRLALSLVNRQQVKGKGFVQLATGAVHMNEDTLREVLVAYQRRKKEEITHPYLGERVPLGLVPHVQAMLLARHLRGNLDGYPPFLWK